MKTFVVGLLLMASSISFADTISGIVRKANDNQTYQLIEDGSGQPLQLDVHLGAGSVCGQVLNFERALDQALGQHVELTGLLKRTNSGVLVFKVDNGGVAITAASTPD